MLVEGRQRKDRTHLAHAVGDRQNRWKNWHSGGHGVSFRFFQKVEMQTALRCYRRLRDDQLAIPPSIGEKVLGLLLRDLLGRQVQAPGPVAHHPLPPPLIFSPQHNRVGHTTTRPSRERPGGT